MGALSHLCFRGTFPAFTEAYALLANLNAQLSTALGICAAAVDFGTWLSLVGSFLGRRVFFRGYPEHCQAGIHANASAIGAF